MKKPTKVAKQPTYDYNEIIDFIEVDGVRMSFWRWLIEYTTGSVTNGSYISFPSDWRLPTADEINGPVTQEDLDYHEKHSPAWAREIMEMIVKEFPGIEDEEVWVEW